MAEKIRLSKKQRKMIEEDRLANDQWSRYVRARDNGHTDYLKLARRCNDFYIGEQWEKADLTKLDNEGRPHLTINLVLSSVNAVLGEQKAKRVDFKYKPAQGGREDTAQVLSKIVRAIKDANSYDYVESQVFEDGIIQHGRGFFDIRMSFKNNMQGDIVIRSDDSLNIILDPDAKEYDPDTWTEVFETRWLSVDEISATYGQDKADAVTQLGINGVRFDQDSIVYEEDPAFGDAREAEKISTTARSEEEEKSIRSVRVIERQHVKYEAQQQFVDPVTGDLSIVPNTWNDKRVREFADQYGLFVTKAVAKRVRWTVTADKVVLHDDWSPYKTFTKIPYFAYFRRGKPFGLVSNLVSPQEQLNKLSSQELHIVNTTANSGWIVEAGALSNMTADDLRNQGAETGLVIEVNKGRAAGIEKIKPNTVPTGIDRISSKAAAYMKEISGVNDALLGFGSNELSGVALENKEARGTIQMQVPFDNLALTRTLVSDKLIELIQQFYTDERVFRLVSDDLDRVKPDEMEEIIINRQDAVGNVVNDVTVGKYETVLSFAPARDSMDDMSFAEMVSLRSIGIQIPDDRIIEVSHVNNRDKLAQELRDIQGRGELTEQQIAEMQFQQMIGQQLAQLEVEKAAAEVMKLEAEAAKAASEAGMKEGGMLSPEAQMHMNELEVKLQVARDNLMMRRDLAQLSAANRLDSTVLNVQGKVITDRNKGEEDRKTARINTLNKGSTTNE